MSMKSSGLLVTLNNLPENGIVLLFTDAPSKGLEKESELIRLRDQKKIKIFVVLAPQYGGKVGDQSWQMYTRLSEGKIYNMKDFSKEQFLKEIVQVVATTC